MSWTSYYHSSLLLSLSYCPPTLFPNPLSLKLPLDPPCKRLDILSNLPRPFFHCIRRIIRHIPSHIEEIFNLLGGE